MTIYNISNLIKVFYIDIGKIMHQPEIRKIPSLEPALQTAPNFKVMHIHTRPSYSHRYEHLTCPCSNVTGHKVTSKLAATGISNQDRVHTEPNSPANEYKVTQP